MRRSQEDKENKETWREEGSFLETSHSWRQGKLQPLLPLHKLVNNFHVLSYVFLEVVFIHYELNFYF